MKAESRLGLKQAQPQPEGRKEKRAAYQRKRRLWEQFKRELAIRMAKESTMMSPVQRRRKRRGQQRATKVNITTQAAEEKEVALMSQPL